LYIYKYTVLTVKYVRLELQSHSKSQEVEMTSQQLSKGQTALSLTCCGWVVLVQRDVQQINNN